MAGWLSAIGPHSLSALRQHRFRASTGGLVAGWLAALAGSAAAAATCIVQALVRTRVGSLACSGCLRPHDDNAYGVRSQGTLSCIFRSKRFAGAPRRNRQSDCCPLHLCTSAQKEAPPVLLELSEFSCVFFS